MIALFRFRHRVGLRFHRLGSRRRGPHQHILDLLESLDHDIGVFVVEQRGPQGHSAGLVEAVVDDEPVRRLLGHGHRQEQEQRGNREARVPHAPVGGHVRDRRPRTRAPGPVGQQTARAQKGSRGPTGVDSKSRTKDTTYTSCVGTNTLRIHSIRLSSLTFV
ncbi:hypothetical protein MTO96_021056 [Rhipicephalus appendiculatus]